MNRVITWALLAALASLAWFSAHLAATRAYQVDECQNIYMASILAAGQEKTFYTDASGFTIPLSWLVNGTARSADRFASARFLMLGIFWLNLGLIALCTGEKLVSRRGLIALFAAATLAPLWDFGFEIRHDNVLLTGLLLIWCVLRVRPNGLQSYFIAGAVALGLQFVASKAFAYTAPLSLAFLVFPPAAHQAPRWKLTLAWIGGAVATFLLARLAYGALGLWDVYLTDVRGFSDVSTHAQRFAPWATLGRLPSQIPFLLALIAGGLVALIAKLRRRAAAALSWDGNLPEALLFLGAIGVLFVNPTPFPYNLLLLVPFGSLFAFRYAVELAKALRELPAVLPLAGAILIFAHLVPFWTAARRHLSYTNARQESLMFAAENLTDPQKDRVYDAMGMVPTRPSIGFRWFLHSLNIQSFIKGPGPRVRDMLAERPAAVFIPSYRTDWLPEEDHDFLRQRYVAMLEDFWVLGKVLPVGGGTFEIFHPGRYRISTLQASRIQGTFTINFREPSTAEDKGKVDCTLDGKPSSAEVVEMTRGQHRIEAATNCQPAVVWVGPRGDRVHRLDRSEPRR